MDIKEVLKYDWNYAEYTVTDGDKDVICMCISVPLPNNKIPEIGMKISMLYAFNFDAIEIVKLTSQEDKIFLLTKEQAYFEYRIRGKIIDTKKALVQVWGFIISLEYQFENGFSTDYSNGDFIDFKVDRLDCLIDV